MRVLQVVHDYLPEHVGGAEVHAHQLARALAARGHELTCAFTERDPSRAAAGVRQGALDGVATLEFAHSREYARPQDSWLEPGPLAVFEALLRELEPEVVHFHHTATWGPACIAAARRAGCVTLVTLHDFHWLCDNARAARDDGAPCLGVEGRDTPTCEECLVARFGPGAAGLGAERRRFHARMLAQAQRVICPSRFMALAAQEHARLAPERLRVIPPGARGEQRAPRASDARQPLRVGFVGGLFPAKGAHVAIAALRRLRGAPLELHVHGVLEWFPDYVASLRELARGAAVRFHGRFAPESVEGVLDALDVLVVPSLWYENAPLVVQDAFRRGLPVLASDTGGLRELLAGGGGLLVPRGDAEALAWALRTLARDRQRLHALACAAPRPTPIDDVARRVEALFDECVAESG